MSELLALQGRLTDKVKAIEDWGLDEVVPFLRRRTTRLRQECTLVETVIKLHKLALPLEPLP